MQGTGPKQEHSGDRVGCRSNAHTAPTRNHLSTQTTSWPSFWLDQLVEPGHPPVRAPVCGALSQAVVLLASQHRKVHQILDGGQGATAALAHVGLHSRLQPSHRLMKLTEHKSLNMAKRQRSTVATEFVCLKFCAPNLTHLEPDTQLM